MNTQWNIKTFREMARKNSTGLLSLLGCFIIHLSLGSFYCFGNLTTYMTSYMKNTTSPDITYGDFIIVQSVYGMSQGIILPLSGYVAQFIGLKNAIIVGCIIFQIATYLTYFSLQHSLVTVSITYGFLSSLGANIALIPPMTIVMGWFPKHKGKSVGVTVGGFGLGALVFNYITTAVINPNNVSPVRLTPNSTEKYFTDPEVLRLTPYVSLLLGGLYTGLHLIGWLLIRQPPAQRNESPETIEINQTSDASKTDRSYGSVSSSDSHPETEKVVDIFPKDALRTKEFYLVFFCRFLITPITQVTNSVTSSYQIFQTIGAYYKTFGQIFIDDDLFLVTVGSLASIFNCCGRLFYGFIMDRSSYKRAMLIETSILTILCSTFYLCFETQSKAMFAIWVWAIFFTFPGTYAIQPAVINQTFGQKYGGTIYGFTPTSDIINNLMVGVLSKQIIEGSKGTLDETGYLGLFLCLGLSAIGAFIFTIPLAPHPSPNTITYLWKWPKRCCKKNER